MEPWTVRLGRFFFGARRRRSSLFFPPSLSLLFSPRDGVRFSGIWMDHTRRSRLLGPASWAAPFHAGAPDPPERVGPARGRRRWNT